MFGGNLNEPVSAKYESIIRIPSVSPVPFSGKEFNTPLIKTLHHSGTTPQYWTVGVCTADTQKEKTRFTNLSQTTWVNVLIEMCWVFFVVCRRCSFKFFTHCAEFFVLRSSYKTKPTKGDVALRGWSLFFTEWNILKMIKVCHRCMQPATVRPQRRSDSRALSQPFLKRAFIP